MHTMPKPQGDDTVCLSDLINQLNIICLSTRGRIRRLNRYWMGVDLITALTPPGKHAEVQAKLLDVARDCGLAESPEGKSFISSEVAALNGASTPH